MKDNVNQSVTEQELWNSTFPDWISVNGYGDEDGEDLRWLIAEPITMIKNSFGNFSNDNEDSPPPPPARTGPIPPRPPAE